MLHYLTLTACLVTAFLSGAQNEFNVWHFGSTAIDFNSGTAVALPQTSVFSSESTSGICNAQGQLLFYSNGGNSNTYPAVQGRVWNANHQVMPNGLLQNIAGCHSTYQGIIVLPDPANGITKTQTQNYYIITLDCVENMYSSPQENKGLRYTKIDMSLDNGLGDVTQKGIPIVPMPIFGSNATINEVLTAMPHINGQDYWIHFGHSDSVGTVLLTANGFSAPFNQDIDPNKMAASPANNKLAVDNRIYDFNPMTGLLTHLATVSGSSPCFSPSGEFLYMMNGTTLYQYDVTLPDIPGSQTVISTAAAGTPILAPDRRIYFMGDGNNPIRKRINCPNGAGASCGFDPSYQLQLTGTVRNGNPNFLQSTFYYPGNPCTEPMAVTEQELVTLIAWPNPSAGTVRISHPFEVLDLNLTDVRGRNMASLTVKSGEEIDLTSLNSGIYFFVPAGKEAVKPLRLEILNP